MDETFCGTKGMKSLLSCEEGVMQNRCGEGETLFGKEAVGTGRVHKSKKEVSNFILRCEANDWCVKSNYSYSADLKFCESVYRSRSVL